MKTDGLKRAVFCAVISTVLIISPISSQWTDTLFMSVYFATDHYDLSPSQERDIKLFVESIPDLRRNDEIHIMGQADYRGSTRYNQKLSEKRATEVYNYITTMSTEVLDHMTHIGAGESNATKDLHQERRVDIIVYNHRNDNSKPVAIDDFSEVDVASLREGSTLRINKLLFIPGRSRLLQESIPHLKALHRFLLEYPSINIRIEGHVCCLDKLTPEKDGYDTDAKKYNLSEGRAKNIYNYLIRNDISPDRLDYKGLGGSQPNIYPEVSEEDAKQNRNVEIVIASM